VPQDRYPQELRGAQLDAQVPLGPLQHLGEPGVEIVPQELAEQVRRPARAASWSR
jgi:hypothetical protein